MCSAARSALAGSWRPGLRTGSRRSTSPPRSGTPSPRRGGEGLVIGAEHEPRKVASARRNLRRAGLEDHAEIREGDLRETLRGLEGPVDFMLIDLWIPMALPALDLVTPVLRPGALVICDKVISGRRGYAEYLARVRDPDGPFVSVTIPGRGGLEISMKR
ncbi:O-methyltransferase [Leucobacter sp. wl10]|uniref:O-methyltransferase n=1 Tax=Leucobacter sp. wl10 TaxID=2304677 RepID=UPI00210F9A9C|nr:class I SAM-dependent methyltransferase [Leucobacter sp. wl10]